MALTIKSNEYRRHDEHRDFTRGAACDGAIEQPQLIMYAECAARGAGLFANRGGWVVGAGGHCIYTDTHHIRIVLDVCAPPAVLSSTLGSALRIACRALPSLIAKHVAVWPYCFDFP